MLKPLSSYGRLIKDEPVYSDKVLDLVRTTNIRLTLLKLHTLGNEKLDNSSHTAEKYYFAINGMNIRGRCSCYGHSSQCVPAPGEEDIPEMVYGVCNCSHNTAGKNCERCRDFYHDLPWKPSFGNHTHACKSEPALWILYYLSVKVGGHSIAPKTTSANAASASP